MESGKDSAIVIPPAASPQMSQLDIPSRPSPEVPQKSIGIYTDTTHTTWKEVLQAGHTYDLRFSGNNGGVFACYTDELGDQPENLPPAQKLSVGREGGKCSFIAHDNPAPPRIFARLELPDQAHLTGHIPFTLVIEYTTDSLNAIVVDKSRSPLSVSKNELTSLDSLIDCRDSKTGEKVPWCAVFLCYDSDPHPRFPDDGDFIELSADKPWRFECTLENLETQDEYVRSMEGLEAAHTYKARVEEYAFGKFRFKRWQYGKKDELLHGSQEEKMKRWDVDMNELGHLDIERIGEHVYFEAIA